MVYQTYIHYTAEVFILVLCSPPPAFVSLPSSAGGFILFHYIDLNFKSELNGEMATNLERMAKGYPPHDPITNKAYQLHHIGQKSDATLAVLTETEHNGKGNTTILHMLGKESEIDRPEFASVRKKFWQSFAESVK